jgi:L-ascorbate metabolism protein UlaG (beta-lactamase superfamily)
MSEAPVPRQPARPQPKGAQRRDGLFLNPDGSRAGPSQAQIWRLMRERSQGTPWPSFVEDPAYPAPQPAPEAHVAVTFIGHASFLLQFHNGPTLLTDPIWSERCSPFRFAGPKRVRRPGLAFDALPRIDAVLLSHNHYDHCDIPTLRRLRDRFAPRIFTGLGNGKLLARHGMKDVVELDWWGDAALPGGATATYLPAKHVGARTLLDRGRTLWGGFGIRPADGGSVYFTGDSAWGGHFEEIGHFAGPFDLALLPIGAYEPRWFMQQVHMNPEEAVRAFQALRTRQALAMHFGTFKLTQEAIGEPARALGAARAAAGIPEEDFIVPGCGETFVVPLTTA